MAKVYLQITMKVDAADRSAAAGVYNKYRPIFLDSVRGALSKELLIRNEDVQVLHSFVSEGHVQEYINSELFSEDVVGALRPYLKDSPIIQIYKVA